MQSLQREREGMKSFRQSSPAFLNFLSQDTESVVAACLQWTFELSSFKPENEKGLKKTRQ